MLEPKPGKASCRPKLHDQALGLFAVEAQTWRAKADSAALVVRGSAELQGWAPHSHKFLR